MESRRVATTITGPRAGHPSPFRGLVSRAIGSDLTAFVVPDERTARAAGLDLGAAGLRLAATPRHASVLLVVGDLPDGLARAAAVAYAQMPRPRAILAAGSEQFPWLPSPDVRISLDQRALAHGVRRLRELFAAGAFTVDPAPFELPDAEMAATEQMPATGHDHAMYTGVMGHGGARGEHTAERTKPMDHAAMGHADHAGHPSLEPPPAAGHGAHGDAPVPTPDADASSAGHGHDHAHERQALPAHGGHHQSAPVEPAQFAADREQPPLHAHADHGSHGDHGGHRPPGAGHDDHPLRHDDTAAEPAGGHEHHTDHAMMGLGDTDSGATEAGAEHGAIDHAATGHGIMGDSDADAQDHAAMDHAAMGHAGSDHSEMEHAAMGHGTMNHSAMDHSMMGHGMAAMDHSSMGHDMAGMDHSAHMMGGFMSMVAMTKDLPRSADSLPMEWVDAPFGPLFPGLPGGLGLKLTLDGDGVARAALEPGALARGLDATWHGPAETFPDRLARLDPLAPCSYRVLALRGLSEIVSDQGDEHHRVELGWVGAVERERAASHLGWLAEIGKQMGAEWMADQAARWQLALVRATTADDVARLVPDIRRFARRVERIPMLRRRLAEFGVLPSGMTDARGPVARGSGAALDARTDDRTYQALGFRPKTANDGDALARFQVRLAEIGQSLDLVKQAGAMTAEALPLPSRLSGMGMASVETPRGAAFLHVEVANGEVIDAHVDPPSGRHAVLVPAVAEGLELADALVGIASLDLSPWEIDA